MECQGPADRADGRAAREQEAALIADLRDESAEDVRIVIEPRNRTVDPAVMMESLFRLTDLESRIPLNMNVLMDGQVPRVVSASARSCAPGSTIAATCCCAARGIGSAAIERRLEILGGLLIAYLNLDEVIRIIRQEDEPKTELMRVFSLTELQANAILDTRLRALRKLEEMEIKREFETLTEEKGQIERLLGSPARQWKLLASDIKEIRKAYGPQTALGKRRTIFSDAAPLADVDLAEAIMEREPLTFVLSDKGWVRALKGHVPDLATLQFKGDDSLKLSFFAEITAKVLVLASNGKLYTLDAGKLPGGRGFGDPVKLIVDFDEGADVVTAIPYRPGREASRGGQRRARFHRASRRGRFFKTRKGKQLLNVAHRRKRCCSSLPMAITSPRSARTASSSSSRSPGRRDGARLGRAPAALPGRGPLGCARLHARRRLDLARQLGPHLDLPKSDLSDWLGNRGDAGVCRRRASRSRTGSRERGE